MHKVTIFSRVMNAASILERKDRGDVLVARTNSVCMRFDFQICADQREGVALLCE